MVAVFPVLFLLLLIVTSGPVAAAISNNVVLNGDFSSGLLHWSRLSGSTASGVNQVISGRLQLRVQNNSAGRVGIGQNVTGGPFSVSDNPYLDFDSEIDTLLKPTATSYVTGVTVNLTIGSNTFFDLRYFVNVTGAGGTGNPLPSSFSNSTLSNRGTYVLKIGLGHFTHFGRNVTLDLQQVAPALDPTQVYYNEVLFNATFFGPSATTNDYLVSYYDNLVIGGKLHVTVNDVAGATVTLDSDSTSVPGSGVAVFDGVSVGTHTLQTSQVVAPSPAVRYNFASWTISSSSYTSNPITIQVTTDLSVKVNRLTQFNITVRSSSCSGPACSLSPVKAPTNVQISVDGATYTTPVGVWLTNGTTHQFQTQTSIHGSPSADYMFSNWWSSDFGGVNNGLNPANIPINSAGTLWANYSITAPNFYLTASSTVVNLFQGQSDLETLSITVISGFNKPIVLAATAPSGTPGLTATVSPTNSTPPFQATISIGTTSSTPAGSYPVTITATGGGLSHSLALVIDVNPTDYTITATPTSLTVYQGQSVNCTIDVASAYFPYTVTLAATIQPTSTIALSIGTSSGTPTFSSLLTIHIPSNATTGSYTITVNGTSSGGVSKSHSVTLTLQVNQRPPKYSVTVQSDGLANIVSTTVYVDGVDQQVNVNDAKSQTFGPYDGLTSHTFEVSQLVSNGKGDSEWMINGAYRYTVSNATTLTFRYSVSYRVEFTTTGLPSGTSVQMLINGQTVQRTAPVTYDLWQPGGSTITFSVETPKFVQSGGHNYTFTGWVDRSNKTVPSPITLSGPLYISAKYAVTQFILTVRDLNGANVTLDSTTLTVGSNGYVTFPTPIGSHTISTQERISSGNGMSEEFKNWTMNGSTLQGNPQNITITDSDLTLYVNRGMQVTLTLTSVHGAPQGAGWYDLGSVATISVSSPVQGNSQGLRYACTGTEGNLTGATCSATVTMDKPKAVQFEWKTQFLLTGTSQYGAVLVGGDNGWYDANATAIFTATAPETNGTRYVFQSWSGDYSGSSTSGTILMNAPHFVQPLWHRMFLTSLKVQDVSGSPASVDSLMLTAPNGTALPALHEENSWSLWLDEGTWKVTGAYSHGVNVASAETYQSISPNSVWKIAVQLYTLSIAVNDMITGNPIQGATISTQFPDGTPMSTTTGDNGIATFNDLPPWPYEVKISSTPLNQVATKLTIDPSVTQTANTKTTSNLDLIITAAVLAGCIVGVTLYIKFKRTKNNRSAPEAAQ
jgi:hypothetical protein